MVLYGITLVPLEEDLSYVYPTLLSPFYTNDAAFDVSDKVECVATTITDGSGAGPEILPLAGQVTFHCQQPGGEEGGEAEIRSGRLTYKLCRW